MRKLSILLITLAAALFVACPAGTETVTNTNTAEPEKTLEATIAELDKAAGEAWAKKDGKFFETFLTDNFVGNGAAGRSDKAIVVKSISESPCEIKSAETTDGKLTEIADGVALYTGKENVDGTCDGKEVPDGYFSTLYVKDGDTWKAAYYQSREIPPAAAAAKPAEGADKPEDAAEEAKKDEKPAADTAAKKEEAAPMKPNIQNDEETAKALTEIEKGFWEAWAKKDTKVFEDGLAANFSEIADNGYMDRAAAIKIIGEHKCEVTSTGLSDAMATKVTDSIYIFTYQGKAAGTCDGKPMPDAPSHTTTIYMKDGDKWKPVFHMGTPEMSM